MEARRQSPKAFYGEGSIVREGNIKAPQRIALEIMHVRGFRAKSLKKSLSGSIEKAHDPAEDRFVRIGRRTMPTCDGDKI